MDYDYENYCKILKLFLDASNRDPDDLQIGVNISDMPEVKITFEGYGDLETEDENGDYAWIENGNENMESYAIFIHKDALKEGFEFPEHDVYAFIFGRMIQHRPAEEVCIYAWYDVVDDEWEILQLEDRIDKDNVMNEKDVMTILEGLKERYFSHVE